MVDMTGTSWQQRYCASQIFTLRCRITDKPGMFAKLSDCLGRAGAYMGEINLVGLENEHKIRDVTVYLADRKQLDKLLEMVKSIDGTDIISVTDEILEIHRRGSIEVVSRVPIENLTDLRMLYTPGVAAVCEEVKNNPAMAWEMTGICDRVAIATNGTAVLGLGNIGPVASLPVMEGKAAILAEFVGISGFPVLIDTEDIDIFVETVVRIASGFGAIQLEDIAAPDCFEIEEKLRAKLNIPVFHDDQHGTATVVLAALINAIEQTNKNPRHCSVVMLGAGAAGFAISQILLEFGIGDIVLYDSKGAIYRGRSKNMNPYKQQLAKVTNKNNEKGSLSEGFIGKDIFIGVSRPNMVSKEMVASMAKDPVVLPLSNPVGEISKEEAIEAGAAIAADGRDINNALAYPGIFRGALDARATQITLAMQLAAAEELAGLAPANALLPDILERAVHEKVAQAVAAAWEGQKA
ncbi:MAG TPA: NAD-dependent malic enzyme [Phycisphaerales bacterium]|nr:NAD-dependent malic enzyme [Phycisphaerales bacterium]